MRRIAIIILYIVGLISLDFLSKWIFDNAYFWKICSNLYETLDIFTLCHSEKYIPIFWEYLWFQLAYNSGVAFWLPIPGLPLQIITIVLVLALLGYYFHTEYPKKSNLLDAGYILIIAGALSHAYERIFIGHVIDFISVKYFAILNFADIFISIGALLLFVVYYCNNTNNDLKNSSKI
jgi:signal peptidase II